MQMDKLGLGIACKLSVIESLDEKENRTSVLDAAGLV
tara:strand:+ start:245 stop:355 length:111 start_codon:yes stop_codon:yes gene_type:complete